MQLKSYKLLEQNMKCSNKPTKLFMNLLIKNLVSLSINNKFLELFNDSLHIYFNNNLYYVLLNCLPAPTG